MSEYLVSLDDKTKVVVIAHSWEVIGGALVFFESELLASNFLSYGSGAWTSVTKKQEFNISGNVITNDDTNTQGIRIAEGS